MIRIALSMLSAASLLFASVDPVVPEPSTYLLMGAGLGALLYARKKFGKKK